MKNLVKNIVLLVSLSTIFVSCEKNIFGPNTGSIKGTIQDNNGTLISGATVTVTYEEESGETTKSVSKNAVSDNNGYYTVTDVPLDEVLFSVDKSSSFEEYTLYATLTQSKNNQSINVTLKGSPTLQHIKFTNDDSLSAGDSLNVTITIIDGHESSDGATFTVVCLFTSTTDATNVDMEMGQINRVDNGTSIATIKFPTSDLTAGSYSTKFTVTDSDGNTHELDGENITVN